MANVIPLDIDKLAFSGAPACVYYSISKYGETMIPVLEQMCAWGRIHLARTKASDGMRKTKPGISRPPDANKNGATRRTRSGGY